jgi:hypothetical protein
MFFIESSIVVFPVFGKGGNGTMKKPTAFHDAASVNR